MIEKLLEQIDACNSKEIYHNAFDDIKRVTNERNNYLRKLNNK